MSRLGESFRRLGSLISTRDVRTKEEVRLERNLGVTDRELRARQELRAALIDQETEAIRRKL